MLKFGARATGEPWMYRTITCDAANSLNGVVFPSATARVMLPERTFWEKATAIHVFCLHSEFRGGERFSRHWHDLTRLDLAGAAAAALADRGLAHSVATHKSMFFPEKDSAGVAIDYVAAVSGELRLVPAGYALASLSLHYAKMLDDGLLPVDAESFHALLEKCRDLEARANKVK